MWRILFVVSLAGAVGNTDDKKSGKSSWPVQPRWQVGCEDRVEFKMSGYIHDRLMRPLPGLRWDYQERYTDKVTATTDGRPTALLRTYQRHSCVTVLDSSGKKRQHELAVRNPDVEGKPLSLRVKGGRLVSDTKVSLNAARMLREPGALGRWAVFGSVERRGSHWSLRKAELRKLLPESLFRKIQGGFLLGSIVQETAAGVRLRLNCSFKWRPRPGVKATFVGAGELSFDRRRSCVAQIKMKGSLTWEEKKNKPALGELTLEGSVRRRLPQK